jgi:predicted DNA-binding transcriptional regulator AlpA
MEFQNPLPAVPAALADVVLIDGRTAAAVGGMKLSWWLARVASGEAPKPAIQGQRCTRWRLADVRSFWASYATRPNAINVDQVNAKVAYAVKATAAQARRRAAAGGHTGGAA